MDWIKSYQKVAKWLFYWWMNRDLNVYLTQIEEMSFKKSIEEKKGIIESCNHKSKVSVGEEAKQEQILVSPLTTSDYLNEAWNYGTFLVINTYKTGRELSKPQNNILKEAEQIVRDMTEVFKANWYPGSEQVPIHEFIPKPNFRYLFPEIEIIAGEVEKSKEFNEGLEAKITLTFDEPMEAKFRELLAQLDEGTPYGDIFESLLSDKDLSTYIKSQVKEHQKLRHGKRSLKPQPVHYFLLLWQLIYQAVNDIQIFSNKHEICFLKDGQIRCFYNLLNLYIHHVALHGSVFISKKKRELYFAAAALHPLQDDYVDEYGASKEAVDAIHLKLKGGKPQFVDKEVDKIFVLIDVIYSAYPLQKHPNLGVIFQELHRWQVHSKKQQSDEISDEELLEISFKKGGYAFALFGYIAAGEMTVRQFNHFFFMGAIFQLLDDFHDLKEDLEQEVITVWTRTYHRGEWGDGVLNGIIALQQYYENTTELVPDFKNPVLMRRIEAIGIRYDAFRFYSMHSDFFSEEYQEEFESCFPFGFDMTRSFFSNTQKYETFDSFTDFLESMKELFNK